MTPEQRDALKEQLRGPGGQRGIPFTKPESLTKVYAVASGKGGVGKSSVTVNLASALAAQGLRVGIVDAEPLLDLAYEDDCRAEVDMNVVKTGDGRFIEVQGTAEALPFGRDALLQLLDLADLGIQQLVDKQRAIVGHLVKSAASAVPTSGM